MAGRTTAAARCNLHEEWISEVRTTLTDIRIQAENHSTQLGQLVEQRKIQNGRLEKVELKVWGIIIALCALLGGASLPKAFAVATAVMGK